MLIKIFLCKSKLFFKKIYNKIKTGESKLISLVLYK